MIYIFDKNNIKIEFKNVWYNKNEREMRKMDKDLMIRSSVEKFITFKVQEKDKGVKVW